MKKFLVYTVVFFAIVALVDFAFGLGARYLNSHAKGGDTYNHYYITHEMSDSVLVFGSSRAIHHFNPRILEDSLGATVYNCGLDGNGILYHYGRLLAILRRHTPKMIIYDVIPSFDMEDDDFAKYLKWQKRWYDIPGVPEIFQDVNPLEKYKMLSSLYRYNRTFIPMLSDNIKPNHELDYKGYKPIYETMSVDLDRQDHHTPVEWSELKKRYFQKFVDTCRQRRVKIVFSFSPWYKAADSGIYDEFRTFAGDNGLEIIDMYTDPELTGDPSLFADISHLNSAGADKFSAKFAGELKRLQTSQN